MFKFSAALVTTVVLAAAAVADKPKGNTKDFSAAFVIAQQERPQAQLIRGRVEFKNGLIAYGFYFWDDGRLFEIEVQRGKVIKHEEIERPDNDVSKDVGALIAQKNKAKTKLPDGRLFEIARDQLKDTAFTDLKYDRMGDKLVIRLGDLVIDAETGRVLSGNK